VESVLPVLRVKGIADWVYEGPEEVIHTTPDHKVVFEYKVLSFSNPSADMRFIYRLKGHERGWRPAGMPGSGAQS